MIQIIYYVVSIIHSIIYFLKSTFASFTSSNGTDSSTGSIIEFDNGISITIETKIAEGGFSYIYSAHDSTYTSRKYALKRIFCPDEDIIIACRNEAKVHRMLLQHEDNVNILPLLGVKFESGGNVSSTMTRGHAPSSSTVCYMLFPLVTGGTLRDEISKRKLLRDDVAESDRRPFSERELLTLFKGILHAVIAMHDAGLAHYDIKLDNVLLDKSVGSQRNDVDLGMECSSSSSLVVGTPILMDFGSARPLVVKLSNRRTVLNLVEEASQHSTVSYRAPELFDGGCRHGLEEPDIDGGVDVWSCGCLLYGMMYGTSPFEMDFRHDGTIRIEECTYLRVLGGKVPTPPPHCEIANRYSDELIELVKWILNGDRSKRPQLDDVYKKVGEYLSKIDEGVKTNRKAFEIV